MVGGLTTDEFACQLSRQLDGRANRVHAGELPSQSIPSKAGDDDIGTSKKRKRAVAKGGQVRTHHAAKDAAEADADEEEDGDREAESEEDDGSHGYTPSPAQPKSGVGSHVSHVRLQDVVGAKALLAISSFAAKPGSIARKKKKKKGGVVQVTPSFSDSEESDSTPTSPALWRAPPQGRRLSPPPASDAEVSTGGSASAPAVGANVFGGERVEVVPPSAGREGPRGRNDHVGLSAPSMHA
uniref:Uncharacterized protein n=1 Tax=Oryza meridionalis TaxID=40149 RepID=A0A0E0F571_9ORYZ